MSGFEELHMVDPPSQRTVKNSTLLVPQICTIMLILHYPHHFRLQFDENLGTPRCWLITAYTLLQDGFSNVQLITRDKSVGGVWARERIYPGLTINNVYGEFRFSSLPMPPPINPTGGRLSGEDMCNYMESFADAFLKDKIRLRLRTEVWSIRRGGKAPWIINVENLTTGLHEHLEFDKLVVCTGGCSAPRIPPSLSVTSMQRAGFRGLVLHSNEFDGGSIVVVGGGKSAQDISSYLANEGRKVTVVFDTMDAFLGTPITLPAFIRKSRFLPIISPHIELRTRLERFLHGTWLGAKIVHFLWDNITQTGFNTFKIPPESPLRRAHSLFWSIRTNDEGAGRPNGFHALVNAGVIEVIAPAHVEGYATDGRSVLLSNGKNVPADVVVLCTGYTSSWGKIFDASTASELGIETHPPTIEVSDDWNYASLANPPTVRVENELWASSIYRGIVPAKSIARRDFAVNGAMFSTNNGYTCEVVAHWISAYFIGERMRLPSNAEEALYEAARNAAWMKKRYPGILAWTNESYSAALPFWNWPQAVDQLLDDLYLPSLRSGTIDLSELSTLSEERRAKRAAVGST
ncbi:hypothetical protein BDQ17DRAFT_1401381 [Cyathus striatus]|nr:hypothetical protein BDQ17DRAFT_1401381 [Cyathus striatus]